MERENKIQNVFLACVGYAVNLVCNSGLLLLFATIFNISTTVIIEQYWFIFSVGYAFILWGILFFLRWIFQTKLKIGELFMHTHKVTQYSLIANLVLYIVIFLINISLGEETGYSLAALRFNGILFAICLLVNSGVIIECTKGIEIEEKRKAELHQQKLLENYVVNLEQMLEDMRAFKHDYKNILSTMAGYIRENKIDELRDCFYKTTELPLGDTKMQTIAWKYLRDIKPMELKGFLYEKMLLILTRDIRIQVSISEDLEFKYNDMETVIRILGIFIDNAIEEAEKLTDGWVGIVITKTKVGVLFRIENNYAEKPELSLLEKKGYSTKGKNRGMGLYWVHEKLLSHEDMFHELQITDEKVSQILEIEQ
jgi:sensor histidine kinase YesM